MNPVAFPPQNFAVQGNFQAFTGVVAPQTFPTVAPQQQQQQQFVANPQQWGQYIQPNQYSGFQAQFAAAAPAVAAPVQYTGQPVQNAGFITPNPFGAIPSATPGLQQQFASLNLGNPAPAAANAAPTVAATNLWQ